MTHDCFVSVYRTAPTYRPLGKPIAWILTIARNLCLMKIRERRKFTELPDEDWQTAFEDTRQKDPDDRIVLEACMEKLARRYRRGARAVRRRICGA